MSESKWQRALLKLESFPNQGASLCPPLFPSYCEPDPELKTFVKLKKCKVPVEVSAILKSYPPIMKIIQIISRHAGFLPLALSISYRQPQHKQSIPCFVPTKTGKLGDADERCNGTS
ncbi:unnamed protein product [Strongylus vulgaris]|uniref:Uncharacterized protein n=1 Tax=Strongylus vulgaris TaxID=40348 RepID=A0A3P7J133_STRVU|nr:unnamed protein product [Strongylus vulgaris]